MDGTNISGMGCEVKKSEIGTHEKSILLGRPYSIMSCSALLGLDWDSVRNSCKVGMPYDGSSFTERMGILASSKHKGN